MFTSSRSQIFQIETWDGVVKLSQITVIFGANTVVVFLVKFKQVSFVKLDPGSTLTSIESNLQLTSGLSSCNLRCAVVSAGKTRSTFQTKVILPVLSILRIGVGQTRVLIDFVKHQFTKLTLYYVVILKIFDKVTKHSKLLNAFTQNFPCVFSVRTRMS